MFPYLRSLSRFEPGPAVLGAQELDDGAGGKIPGPMDGGSPGPNDASQDNPRIKAGYTFLGQFIDHDMTFDPSSVLERQIDPGGTRNFRTPVLELDSLYGQGPGAALPLRQRAASASFSSEDEGDLPRNRLGRALIGDPRNDENTIVSQLHTLVPEVPQQGGRRGGRLPGRSADAAVRGGPDASCAGTISGSCSNEFLPRWSISTRIAHAMKEAPFRFGDEPFMPVEFSVAAYRFGHSQVRPGYLLSRWCRAQPFPRAAILFPAPSLPPGIPTCGGPAGGAGAADRVGSLLRADAQPSKKIDEKIRLLSNRSWACRPASSRGRRDRCARWPCATSSAASTRGCPRARRWRSILCIPVLPEQVVWAGRARRQGAGAALVLCPARGRGAASRATDAGRGGCRDRRAHLFAALLEADKASFMVAEPRLDADIPPRRCRAASTMSDLVNFTLGDGLSSQEDLDLDVRREGAQRRAARPRPPTRSGAGCALRPGGGSKREGASGRERPPVILPSRELAPGRLCATPGARDPSLRSGRRPSAEAAG
jgi:hypothetical protein